MQPRILFRTHYQADEPKLLIASAVSCSSLVESRHQEALASCLVEWSRRRQKKLSLPGATYAVANARSLGFLNDSYRKTPVALAFAYLQDTEGTTVDFAMTPHEERLFLRQYLLGSGALVVEFGKWLLNQGEVTDDQLRDDDIIGRLVLAAVEQYLRLATDIRDRTTIRRERDRLMRADYQSNTKRHKRYPLLASLRRLHLVDVDRNVIVPDHLGRLSALVAQIPDIAKLEQLCRDGSLKAVLNNLPTLHHDGGAPNAIEILFAAYTYALKQGLQACPISFLSDVFEAIFAANEPCEPAKLLDALHAKAPGRVRFHVDRRGQRAYVLIDDFDELRRIATSVGLSGLCA